MRESSFTRMNTVFVFTFFCFLSKQNALDCFAKRFVWQALYLILRRRVFFVDQYSLKAVCSHHEVIAETIQFAFADELPEDIRRRKEKLI